MLIMLLLPVTVSFIIQQLIGMKLIIIVLLVALMRIELLITDHTAQLHTIQVLKSEEL